MTAHLFSGLFPDAQALNRAFPGFGAVGAPWFEAPPSTIEPLSAQVGTNDLSALKARQLVVAGKPGHATAWALGGSDAALAAKGKTVVFVEVATPAAAAPAHAQWLGWQRQALRDGHAAYCIVLSPSAVSAMQSEEACQALNACLKDAKLSQAAVAVRFDAAATLLPCLLSAPQRVSELVLGPLPLWPLPSAQPGVHPLTTLHMMFGWMDNGSFNTMTKTAWQVLGHPVAGAAAPGLLNAAVWQEQLARAPLPADASTQALAAAMGPWLVPGIASVLTDDWALRNVTSASAAPAWPVTAVFAAEEAEPAKAWAQDYLRGLLGALGAQCKLVMGAEAGLRLSAPKAASTAAPTAVPTPVAKAVVRKPMIKPAVVAKPAPVQKAKLPAPKVAVTAPHKQVKKGAAKSAAVAKLDDLKIIEGIGPQIAKLLNQDGITTFEALSRAPLTRLQKVLTAAGPRFAMAKPGTWPQQARLLAKGDKAAFDALTEKLKGGVAV